MVPISTGIYFYDFDLSFHIDFGFTDIKNCYLTPISLAIFNQYEPYSNQK